MDINEYVETPDALFHYTKTSVAIENILYTKKFKLSTLYDTNDPKEFKFKLFNYNFDYEASHELFDEARTEINRILRFKCRIMSFCSNAKPTLILSDNEFKKDEHFCSTVWAKSRMWSQYGENHRGVCLILSKREIEKAFNQVENYKADYVSYLQNIRRYPSVDLSSKAGKNVKECAFKYVMDNLEFFFFQKHLDYRDEGEFRVVVFDPDKKFEYIDISTSLKGVIVGDRIHDSYIHLIDQMCKNLNIECRQAYWSTSTPQMLLCKFKPPDST